MIKIEIKKDQITIKGHSGYDVEGKDIVCAGVSSISITTINAILKYDENSLKIDKNDGLLKVDILKHDKFIDLLIDNMVSLLNELKEQYKDYIEIK